MNADERFFSLFSSTVSAVWQQNRAAVETAAQALESQLALGGMWYTFGTGHGHLLALEVFYRAGGPARVHPILDPALMLHVNASESSQLEREPGRAKALLDALPIGPNDALLIASNSGRNAAPVEMALEARRRGAYVIALTSLRHSSSVAPRNPWGKRLFEVADAILDNGGVPGDAAIDVGDGRPSGATSTAIGSMLLQAIIARVHEIAVQKGDDIGFFASANVDGGDEINETLIHLLKPEVPFL